MSRSSTVPARTEQDLRGQARLCGVAGVGVGLAPVSELLVLARSRTTSLRLGTVALTH
jgi:hypothetical protein